MSDSAKKWQPWEMGMLERRRAHTSQRSNEPESEPVYTRRREDQISITLFDLAKEEAEKKGFEHGHAEGLERGRAEAMAAVRAEQAQALQEQLEATIAPIRELATTFRAAIDGLNEHVSYALVELALEAAQRLAGRALELKPEHILDDVEDLLEEYPALTGSPTLYVNIDDLAVVKAQLDSTLHAAGWQLRPDVSLERGDCRIETDQRDIDATTADRWARLLHAVGHGEH